MGILQEGNSGQTPRTNSKAGPKLTPVSVDGNRCGDRSWQLISVVTLKVRLQACRISGNIPSAVATPHWRYESTGRRKCDARTTSLDSAMCECTAYCATTWAR